MGTHIHIKRAYDPAQDSDGIRILVDRLWPRGLSKAEFQYDFWYKDLAPSTELRTRFGHKPERWDAFQTDYLKELQRPQAQALLKELLGHAKDHGCLTLLYGARDTEHNQAVVIAQALRALES